MIFYTLLFAADAAPVKPDAPSMFSAFLPLIFILILFYIMFIIPHQKEQKKMQEMLKSLKEGDKVLTSGGIVGIIAGFTEKDDTVQIKVGENVKLNILRAYIIKKFEKIQ